MEKQKQKLMNSLLLIAIKNKYVFANFRIGELFRNYSVTHYRSL
uniref:Uncharacterized protein n=1 Tax=Anguilla anguilla TaxID=7936 RepID=A0A0E9XJ32_ANGAN